MKVLFLDIDGVINTISDHGFHLLGLERIRPRNLDGEPYLFDPRSLSYLYTIVEATGCKIVISSTWRMGSDLKTMKSWFGDNIIADAIIDKTPVFSTKNNPELVNRYGRIHRGYEINDWLKRHPEVTNFAILDDDSDMDGVRRDFFKVPSCYDGLDKKTTWKVISHLNKKDLGIDDYPVECALSEFLETVSSRSKKPVKDIMEFNEKIIKLTAEVTKEVTKEVGMSIEFTKYIQRNSPTVKAIYIETLDDFLSSPEWVINNILKHRNPTRYVIKSMGGYRDVIIPGYIVKLPEEGKSLPLGKKEFEKIYKKV